MPHSSAHSSGRGVARQLHPNSPVINAASPPSGTVGVAYSFTFTAAGDTPITWSVSSGALNAGLTLNASSGILSGTPTSTATSTFTVRATNAVGQFTSPTLNIAVVSSAPSGANKIYTWWGVVLLDDLIGGIEGNTLASFAAHGIDGHVISLGSPGPLPAWLRSELVTTRTYGDVFLGMNLADLVTTRGVPQNQTEWNGKIAVLQTLINEAALCNATGFALDSEPYNATVAHQYGWDMQGTATQALFYNNGVTFGQMIVNSGRNPAQGCQLYLASDASWPNSNNADLAAAVNTPPGSYIDPATGLPFYTNNGYRYFVHGLLDAGVIVNFLDASFHSGVQRQTCGGQYTCALPYIVSGVANEFTQGPPQVRASAMYWPDNNEGSQPHQKTFAELQGATTAALQLCTGALSIYTHIECIMPGYDPYPPPGVHGPTYWSNTVMPAILAGKNAAGTVINAKTFAGAAFDGATDDTVKVQQAATAAAGSTLYFPGGFTTRVGQINIPANTTVVGDGPTSILKAITLPTASRYDAVLDCASGVTVSNLKIDGNAAANLPDGWADAYNNFPVAGNNYRDGVGRGRGFRCGIRGESVTSLRVDHVEITACAGACVATNNSSNVTITNCNLHDSSWEGVYMFGGTSPVFASTAGTNFNVNDNTFSELHAPAGANAQGYNPNGLVVSRHTGGNILRNVHRNTDRDFIKLEGCQGTDANNYIQVANNNAAGGVVGYPCVALQPPFGHHDHGSRWIRIHDNSLSGPGFQEGVQLNSSDTTANACQDIEVDHNTVIGGGSVLYGVLADGSIGLTNINIHDNLITDSINAAIYINGGGSVLTMTANQHNAVLMANHTFPGAFSQSVWYNS